MLHHEKLAWVAKNTAPVIAECQSEPKYHPYHGDYGHADKALQHRGNHIFTTHHTPVKESQSGCHDKYQGSGAQHPGSVCFINLLAVSVDGGEGRDAGKEECQGAD